MPSCPGSALVQIDGSAHGDNLVHDIIDQGSTVKKPDTLVVTTALKPASPPGGSGEPEPIRWRLLHGLVQ